jgi:hypothetical protein
MVLNSEASEFQREAKSKSSEFCDEPTRNTKTRQQKGLLVLNRHKSCVSRDLIHTIPKQTFHLRLI